MGEPIRIAIVGTGNIARVHAKALAALITGTGAAGGEAAARVAALVAVMDVDDRQLHSFGTEFGVRETSGTFLTCSARGGLISCTSARRGPPTIRWRSAACAPG